MEHSSLTGASSRLVNICTLEGHGDRVWHLAWSHFGDLLATCGGDQVIRIWGEEGEKWVQKAALEGGHQRTIRRVAWSPDSKYLAAASFDSTVSIWEKKSGHENEVKSVAWDSSGSLLATCSRDKSVWIWEMEADDEFECISVLHGHSQDVKSVVWHPEKEILFSCSYDDTIKVWRDEEDDWFCAYTLSGHSSTVWELSFSPSGNRLASCADDLNIIIWDTTSLESPPKRLSTLSGYHRRTIFSVSWGTNELFATGAADDAIRIFERDLQQEDYSLLLTVEGAHESDVNCVSWRPQRGEKENDPLILASGGDDGVVKLWRFEQKGLEKVQ